MLRNRSYHLKIEQGGSQVGPELTAIQDGRQPRAKWPSALCGAQGAHSAAPPEHFWHSDQCRQFAMAVYPRSLTPLNRLQLRATPPTQQGYILVLLNIPDGELQINNVL